MGYTYYKGLIPVIALSSALPFLASCSISDLLPATRGYVKQEVSGLQRRVDEQYSGLKTEVQKVKERTRAEGVASLFYGEGHDIEVGMMLARIINGYKDTKQREIVEKIIKGYGNRIGVSFMSSNDENIYYGRVVVDDGDKKRTFFEDKTIKGIGAARLSQSDISPEIWKRLVESVSK